MSLFGAACVLIMALENGFSSRRKKSTLRYVLKFLAIDFAIALQFLCMQPDMALRLRKRSTTGGS
jgi:nucleoside permease NupC